VSSKRTKKSVEKLMPTMTSTKNLNKITGKVETTLKMTNRPSKASNLDTSSRSTDQENQKFKSPPSYDSLNNKLMYPNNPAYFHIKKLSSIEHKAK
jgi:hypothetical protein